MMKKIHSYLIRYWTYIASFGIPFFIVLGVYLSQGIYWGSDTSPLLGDGFHQYVIFDTALRNILHGSDSLFYTFTSGLGLNFYALSSYYLGSFLSPFVFFFDVQNMPDSVYLFTLIKFGLMGLSAFISIKGIFKNIDSKLILILSSSYALMSFATSQIEIKTWLDVFILAPLILYGFDKLIKKEGLTLYFTSLTILFIQNYYFGYMMAIFLFFWFLVQVSWDVKYRIKQFFDFTIVSILAGITSLVMILPTILDLRTHGEKLTEISKIVNKDAWYLDLFAKNFIGSFDTTKYGSIPMIYVGLLPLIFAILFFTLKSIKFHVKLAYLLLLGILVASFYIQPLDLFWQGMHAPNMFLYRYSWLFSLLIIFMASETLNRLKEIKIIHILLSFMLVAAGFLATFIYRKHYEFLTAIQFILTLEFLLAYFLILFSYLTKHIPKRLFFLSIIFFSLFEMSLNTFYQVDGIAKEWVFASRSSYSENLTSIDNLVNYANSTNSSFFRTEETTSKTGNDSMKYNYNGISQFSSVRNTMTSSILDKLGFKSAGTNLNLRYQNNSILMDSLFGVKYNLSTSNPNKYGFTPVKTDNNVTLYENSNASQLATLTNGVYKDVKFTNLTLDNQTKFINNITGLDLKYFYKIYPISSTNVLENNNRSTVTVDQENQTNFASATYTFENNQTGQVYLTLPNLKFSNDNTKTVDVTVNGETHHYTTNNVFSFFNLGYFQMGEIVTIRLTFTDNSQVSFDTPEFYSLNVQHYQEALDWINQQNVSVSTKQNTVTATYSSQTDSSLLFTLPYDKGWSASLNGKPLTISKAQKGFMKVDIPEGSGVVQLRFIPQGLDIGIVSFVTGIILFLLYQFLPRLLLRRKSTENTEKGSEE